MKPCSASPLPLLPLLLSLAAAGCGDAVDGAAGRPPDEQVEPEYDPDCAELTLQLLPLDIWGRPLAAPSLEVRDGQGSLLLSRVGQSGALRLPLPRPGGLLTCAVAAEQHLPAELTMLYHGGRSAQSLSLAGEAPPLGVPGRAASLGAGVVDGRRCPVASLYLGLDHVWFAAGGRPPRPGNAVRLMMDGEEQWAAAAEDLRTTTERVFLSTWWWQSDFELVRGPEQPTQDEQARRPQTMIAILDALPAQVLRRVLVARFLPETVGGLENLNTDGELRTRGRSAGSGYEVLLQGNPTLVPYAGEVALVEPPVDFAARIAERGGLAAGQRFLGAAAAAGVVRQPLEVDAASYHQKAFVVDGRVGYIGGMNVKSSDWDTSEHRVFEPRRMKFSSPVEDRQAVAERRLLPDLGPRKDYFVRFAGPAVADLEDLLCDRWEAARLAGEPFAENATPCVSRPPVGGGAPPGAVLAQVVATMPAPLEETSILESLRKAFGLAERFIYIEDQYFRMPILNDALAAALTAHPALQLVVVTKPISSADGGKRWTVIADRQLRAVGGDRYHLFQLTSFDAVLDAAPPQIHWVPIDTHSKMVIVDDRYINVGSCNKNNRGLKFEGELNLAVLDEDFVGQATRRILANLLGPRRAAELSGDPVGDAALLDEVARANAARQQWWEEHGRVDSPAELAAQLESQRPEGFLFPLAFDEVMDFPDVGPDLF